MHADTKTTPSTDKFWKGIVFSVISHCENEAHSFTPTDIDSQAAFDRIVETFLPDSALEPEREAIRQRYNCTQAPFNGNYEACIRVVIQDGFFTCNTRNLFDAYPTSSYMLSYGFPVQVYAYHASDLIPLFMNSPAEAEALLMKLNVSHSLAKVYSEALNQTISPIYQNYLASFAVFRDPNANVGGLSPPSGLTTWPIADGSGNALSSVLQVRAAFGEDPYVLISDYQNTKDTCDFWTAIARDIVSAAPEVGGNWNSHVGQMPLGSDL